MARRCVSTYEGPGGSKRGISNIRRRGFFGNRAYRVAAEAVRDSFAYRGSPRGRSVQHGGLVATYTSPGDRPTNLRSVLYAPGREGD